MALPQIYEGTTEEIAEQLRGSNLTGKFKAILMLEESKAVSTNESGETLDKALAALLAEADRIEREMPVPQTDSCKVVFGEIMQEKYRKMGFKI